MYHNNESTRKRKIECVINWEKKHRLDQKYRNRRNTYNKEYYANHKEKMKKQILENYKLNKPKWDSRNTTNQIKRELPKLPCKFCGSLEVEFHHEIYPKTRREIRQAFKDGLIYWVCLDCHRLKCHNRSELNVQRQQ
jgi:hypothetical protein